MKAMAFLPIMMSFKAPTYRSFLNWQSLWLLIWFQWFIINLLYLWL